MKKFDKYIKSLMIGIKSAVEYRMDFTLNILSGAFTIFVQFYLWTSIFKNSSNEIIYGYTYEQMIIYTILAGILSKLISTNIMNNISADIKDGGLSRFLVQPISYMYFRAANFLGQKFCDISVLLVISSIAIVIVSRFLNINFAMTNIIPTIISIFLSIILNFFICYCFSLVSFWITEVFTLFWGINVVTLILSGSIFPIDIFGKNFYTILSFLPFKYTTYLPINIVIGKIHSTDIAIGIIIQCVWIILLFILSKVLWNIGIKRYIAVGG